MFTDNSLTLEALEEHLVDISDWNGLGRCLRVHRSIRQEIEKNFTTYQERKTAVLKEYIENHPAPSLQEISWCLYISTGDDYNNSEEVKSHNSLKKLYDKNIVPGRNHLIIYILCTTLIFL